MAGVDVKKGGEGDSGDWCFCSLVHVKVICKVRLLWD